MIKDLAMTIEHHDLVHEFPQLRDRIHELTSNVEKMETEAMATATHGEVEAKVHRVHLKDELYRMLVA